MNRNTLSISLLTFLILLSHVEKADAQLMLDQALGSSVGGATELGAVARPSVDQETVVKRLQQQGYTNIVVSPSNPHQFTANSPDGFPLLLTVEARTGQILSAQPQ